MELTFLVDNPTVVSLRAEVYLGPPPHASASGGFDVDSIFVSSHPPAASTRRQIGRTVAVGGSARTQGSIVIDGSGVMLGDVLVMTWPLSVGPGYRPPMTPFFASGSTRDADPGLFSGGRALITTPATYDVPAAALPIAEHGDECPIWGRLAISGASGSAELTITAQTYIGGSPIGPPLVEKVNVDLTPNWDLAPLCSMPPAPTPVGSAGFVRFTITGTSTAGGVYLDEWWLGPPGGAVTAITGTATSKVGIEAPSLAKPYGALLGWWALDRSDAHSIQSAASSWELHDFAPEGVGMFTACDAQDALVSLEHYRRYGTHVAAEPA